MGGGRQRGPDQLRGLLLTLVIYGHTYAAGIADDRSKWIIYGFHMPLFFGLSGWLLTRSSLIDRSLPELLARYWRRMIWQWLLVSVVFGLWKGKLPAGPAGTVRILVLDPLFHLWFIPALLGMLVITQIVLRAGCGWPTLAMAAGFSFVLFELPVGRDHIPESLRGLDYRYGAYFVWFMLGFAVRNAIPASWLRRRTVRCAGIALAAGGAGVYISAFPAGPWQRDIGFAALNTGLILLLPLLISALERPLPLIGEAMTRIGRGSLWIYLLHPFVTETFRHHDRESWRWRLAAALITAAIAGICAAASQVLSRSASGPGRSGRPAPGESAIRLPGPRHGPLTPADTDIRVHPDRQAIR